MRWFVGAGLVVFTASPARAQADVASLNSWRVARFAGAGLRSPIITSLTESESGRIWVSTASGIAWFDGWRFRDGRTEPNMLNRAALAIRPMRGDSVLVLMNNLLYVGDTAGFVQQRILGSAADPADTVEQIVSDAVWTANGMLLLLRDGNAADTPRLARWNGSRAVPIPAPASLEGRSVAALFPAPGGGAWLNTTAGLHRLEGDRWRLVLPSTGRGMLVTRLIEDAGGRVVASVAGGAGPSGVWTWRGTERPRHEASEGEDELLSLSVDARNKVLTAHRSGYLRQHVGNV